MTAYRADDDNLPVTLLGWWRARLRSGSPAAAFVDVSLSPVVGPSALRVELLGARVAVDVRPGTDLAWLRQVVQALS